MNSTEMDVRKNLRSSKIFHNSSCSGYSSSGSSEIEFPICTKGQSNECGCEKCWENVFKNESWNESNFLSSTPMVEEPQITEQNMVRKISVKANELKIFQNYLNPKRVEMNAISKKSKSLKRIIKMKENFRKGSKINPGNVLMSNDERNFENHTSMVPVSSGENFTKFGDFVVWYV
ncbi:hypothetical protein BpHYR1_015513 [Brachionus plicatilis]|uniref:Uncharacterized protein n=1 Tax=Brachionus plicatilis TaxID=10195 RepID=A0A3M7PE32_BRAPC|nr:hypothetical protein BpHYR1_015513 [Brachionus plicatilis]